ncbi:CRISPR system precrRNA processing endoribonuclease RAMP protein Cas6 [bacterium]|nr:CRISPR system precrRNA processing endoribonuclease RAMP protein Cas6 [bacterium]
MERFRTPPKPFVIEPPIHIKPHYYQAGDLFIIKLALIGKALDFIPQWIAVFQKMEKHKFNGINTPFFLKTFVGKNRVTGDGITFFSMESADIMTGNPAFSLSDFIQHHSPAAPISRVTVTFKTPIRIKGAGSLSKAISFKVLIQTLLTRITTLAYNYCQQSHHLNFRELVNLAAEIQIVDEQENLKFHSTTTEKNKHSYLGGYIGQITYLGDLTPFWPLLKFAEIIHLGKNCTFGLGKIHATL